MRCFWILLFILMNSCCGMEHKKCDKREKCEEKSERKSLCGCKDFDPPMKSGGCGCDDDFIKPRQFNAFQGQGTCGCEEKTES